MVSTAKSVGRTPLTAISQRLARWTSGWAVAVRRDPASAARKFFGGLCVLFSLYLLLAEKPWSLGLAEGLAAQKNPSRGQLVQLGFYVGAAVNVVVCLALCLTSRWWTRPRPADFAREAAPQAQRPLWFWVLLLIVVGMGAILRWVPAHRSFWWDEAWPMKKAFQGEWRPDPKNPEALKFSSRRWKDTFFNYERRPTNHVTFSACARISLRIWHLLTGRGKHEFDEFVIRLPALLAGLASIIAIALLLDEWGYRWPGLASSFLFAFHPWHLRYSVEARGYSIVILLTLIAVWTMARALQNGRWAYWLAFGLAQFLLLWSLPTEVYELITLPVFGLAGILLLYRFTPIARVMTLRLLVATAGTLILTLLLVLPLAVQVPFWSEKAKLSGSMQLGLFLPELWSELLTGMDYDFIPHLPETTWYPALSRFTDAHVWLKVTIFYVLPVIVALGLYDLLRRRHPGAWPQLGLFASLVVAIAASTYLRQVIYPRFLIQGLVAVIIALTIGLQVLIRAGTFFAPRVRSWAVPLGMISLVLGFSKLTAAQRHLQLTHPITPARDVAEYMLQHSGPGPEGAFRVGFGNWNDQPAIYDPRLVSITEVRELFKLCERSRAEEKPLLLFYCSENLNRRRAPEAFKLFDDHTFFEPLAVFEGQGQRDYHRVFRYTGRPLPPEPSAQKRVSNGSAGQ